MNITTENITIEINTDGTVDYMDQATTETFATVDECFAFLSEAIERGAGEWWVSECRAALNKLKTNH